MGNADAQSPVQLTMGSTFQRSHYVFLRRDLRQRAYYFANL